jgi:hypothetical protein
MAKTTKKEVNEADISVEIVSESSLKQTEAKLDTVDNILTKTGKILKKHWLLILILIFAYGCYNFFKLVGEEIEKTPIEQGQPIQQAKPNPQNNVFYQEILSDSL